MIDLSALPAGARGKLLVELAPLARELDATIRTSVEPVVDLPPELPAPDLWATTKTVVARRSGRWVVEHFDRHGERI